MKKLVLIILPLTLLFACNKDDNENNSPVAAFIANQTTITEGDSVSFTDQSTNTPTSWSWNFGDGGTSTSQNPWHTYNTAGTYTVSLTVTNNYGSDTETKTDYIDNKKSFTKSYTESDGLINNHVLSIVVDHENNIWFGTTQGLSKFDGTTWTGFTTADGLINDEVKAITVDSLGNLWIGTSGGLSHFDGSTWKNYSESDGLANNDIRSIAVDLDNNIWIGTIKNGISKFDGSTFTSDTVNVIVSQGHGHIHTICCDLAGNIWVGSCISGLSKFNGTNWIHEINGLNSFVMASICASDGAMWFGTYPGLYKLDDTWTKYTVQDGLLYDYITSLTADMNGNIWF
jgi:PKD repeat protein